MVDVKLSRVVPVANGLGECILWDDVTRSVFWTDIPGRRLYMHDPESDSMDHLEFDEDLCSFGFIEASDKLVCAFQSGIAIVDRTSGGREWVYRLPGSDTVRMNDGRVDRQGRFWVGSMVENESISPDDRFSGELYCLDGKGEVRSHLQGIGISNSLCWSPGGDVLYFGDSPKREIYAFDFDTRRGTLSNRCVFARTPDGTVPDGSTVDFEGFIWNAEWGQGRVVRYAPDGTVDTTVQLPASHVTCVAFGGPDLADLYVTTARYGLSEEALREQPQAGDVFVFSTSVHGLPEARFLRGTSGT